jgi:uncharacterized protein (DUF58 family)
LWLGAGLVIFVTGLFKGINLLVLLAYLLGGLWVINWRFGKRDLPGIRAWRRATAPIFAGESTEVCIELQNGSRRAARALMLEDCGTEHELGWLVLRLEPDRPERVRWRQVFRRRGRYALAPLRLTSRFPFGLVWRSVELTGVEEWVVLPRIGRVNGEGLKQWLAKSTRGDGRLRRRKLQPALQEADIHGLRDFRPGDSPRWIHWRSTARRNQLLVREFEESAAPDLVLVVEPWLPDRATSEDLRRLEDVISLAASICREWCRDPLCFLTLVVSRPGPAILAAGSGSGFAINSMETLALEEGHPAIPATKWLDQLPRRERAAPVLILSSRPSSFLVGEVAESLGRPVAHLSASEAIPWYERPMPANEA